MEPTSPDGPDRLPSGRHNLSREFVAQSQRDRLLMAMVQGCDEVGFPDLTVTAIVERAGVSRSTFYEFFNDKEDCFLAAYDAAFGRLVNDLGYAGIETLSWPDGTELALRTLLSFIAREPASAKLCLVEVWSAGPRAIERYEAVVRLLASFLDGGRRETAASSRVPARVAPAVFAGSAMLISRNVVEGTADAVPELIPDLLYTALVPYLGQEEAGRRTALAREQLLAALGEGGAPLKAAPTPDATQT